MIVNKEPGSSWTSFRESGFKIISIRTVERIEESKAVRRRLGYLTYIGQTLGFLPRKRGRRFGS